MKKLRVTEINQPDHLIPVTLQALVACCRLFYLWSICLDNFSFTKNNLF